ncbi:carbohydrate-binding module family 20 domain-containing protein [Chryseobacterium populi]|nr:carbohydrate-binding module family 20 domain-containing protein [Chryseobacterium populi]
MKLKINSILAAVFLSFGTAKAQSGFSTDPLNAVFETKDTDSFWKAFDKMEASAENPFTEYMKNGSPGVKGFTEFRIINADSLYSKVKKRKADYLLSRNVLAGIGQKEKRTKAIYSALKYWYPDAKYPPVYFVYGRFNSGGTVSGDGIILGTEMLKNLDGVTGLIAHELIHFQQNEKGNNTLLKQSLHEGSADFIGELVSGENINTKAFTYGEAHSDKLCREFVTKLKGEDYTDWLYENSKKDDRPNDLGYWIGYKISEAYFNKQTDKHKAVYTILNFQDPFQLLRESGFLDPYIKEYAENKKITFDDFFKEYSDEVHEVTFVVSTPDKNDEVYITGNQSELGSWNPSSIKMNKKSAKERSITLKVHLPAQFKFTQGNWEKEADVKGSTKGQNIKIESQPSKPLRYEITSWFHN